MRIHRLFLCTAVICSLASPSHGTENWPQFRGPNGSCTSTNEALPLEWGPERNVAWKTAIGGVAWSSPIVWQDKVFVTTALPQGEQEPPKKGLYLGGNRPAPREAPYQWQVLCLDLGSGRVLWRRTAAEHRPKVPIHLKNSYASETPTTDGRYVYAWFGAAGLYCYDFSGRLVWSADLGTFPTRFGWGTASSPVLDGERLFLQCDNEKASFVVALDKSTGKEVWRKPRDEGSSWGSPFLWNAAGRTELVTCATRRVRSYDAATGKLLWELGGNSSIAVPTPVAGPELLYVSSGYIMDARRPVFAVRPGASGDLTPAPSGAGNAALAWSQAQAGPYMPSPVYYKGTLYVLYDRGFFAAYEAASGQAVYEKQRLQGAAGQFTSSPWAYRDRVFCQNEDGDTFAIAAGPQFRVVGKNSVGEMCMATPALAGSSLLIRGFNHLFCIRQPGGI